MKLERFDEGEGDELVVTRQSLLSRLRDWNDQESWNEFFEIYWRLIYRTAMKCGLSDAEAQDVVQETVLSACKSMPDFKYDPTKGSFQNWLLRLTRWRIARIKGRRQDNVEILEPPDDTSTGTDVNEDIADPAAEKALATLWDEEWEKNIMRAALERVKQKVDAKHYQVFDLHVMKQWPVDRVMRSLNVSRPTVYMIKHRLTWLFKKEIDRLRDHPI